MTPPDLVVADGSAYVSWNGATEVAAWRVLAGPRPSGLSPLGEVPRAGFETAVALESGTRAVRAEALDADGRVLGRTRTVRT